MLPVSLLSFVPTYLSEKPEFKYTKNTHCFPNNFRSLMSLLLIGECNSVRMECLLEIPASLNKLFFRPYLKIDDRVDELPTIFYKLLKKHSSTLQDLIIITSWKGEEKEMEWKFPIFPVMKRFILLSNHVFEKSVFEINFGNFGPIDYNVCFPVLVIFHISNRMHELSSVAAFLPGEDKCATMPSLRDVDFNILTDVPTAGEQLLQARLYVEMLDLFPHAKDSIMKKLKALLLKDLSIKFGIAS